MSSFQYADNFSSFNDLINRAGVLTEAKKSPYAGHHDSFGSITKELKTAGFSSAPLDTINFIRTILYDLDIIDDEELAAAKRGTGFSAKKNNLLAVLDTKKQEIANNTEAIAGAVTDGLAQYINRSATNRGREEKYAAQAAAIELAKDIKAGADVGDAVEDTVGQLDAAEKELEQSLEISKADPTTLIEIKIRDAERVNDVSEIVTKYANKDGVEVSGDTVQFSVDPETPLAKAVSAHGIEKIEAALKRDVDKISDSVVVVMAPDEDYEQIDDNEEEGPSMANYPGGAPSSYAAGEEGGGLTTPEDEEFDGLELDHFLTKEQPEDYIPSTDYEEVLDALVDDDKRERALKRLNGATLQERVIITEDVINDLSRLGKMGLNGIMGIAKIIDKGIDLTTTGGEAVGRLWNVAKPIAKDVLAGSKAGAEKLVQVANNIVQSYQEYKAGRKEGMAEAEEDFNYSPMLDSYQTSTAGYLTEQSASDKRNIKSEVKNESFKERYKPKTTRQLEELRRYGL